MMTFSKLLVAKYSPKNKCYVSDGVVLFVKPASDLPQSDHVSHFFLSTADRKTTSQYGWVKAVEPFSLNDFIASYLKDEQLSDAMRDHLSKMLSAVGRLDANTPVAATYSGRGVETKTMEFEVHRVFFYREP